MSRSLGLIGMTLAIASTMANAQERSEVPTVYEAGHFYATPVLADGQRLRLVVDTGGAGGSGLFVLQKATVKRLGLSTAPCTLDGETFDTIVQLDFRSDQGLPVHNALPCPGPALVIQGGSVDGDDGQLGAGYLPGHVWTFDYPAQKLWLESKHWQPDAGMHRAALGMLRNAKGGAATGMLRIPIRVDDETIDLLLDTGATAHPSEAGKVAGTEVTASGIGVTSYITSTKLDQWHRKHPDWRVITDGDDLFSAHGTRLIEVPGMVIAGWRLGPVWFTERPDAAFALPNGMSQYMDKPVLGAMGGNVFRHFSMTLDYPNATAWFTCATGCNAAKDH